MCVLNTLVGRWRVLKVTAASYWRDAAARRRLRQEFAKLDDRDLNRVLADVGCSREDLSAIINNAPRARPLLDLMILRLGLERAFAFADPALARDIERRCATCDAQARCRRWLRGDRTGDDEPRFCPNTGNFRALTQAKTA